MNAIVIISIIAVVVMVIIFIQEEVNKRELYIVRTKLPKSSILSKKRIKETKKEIKFVKNNNLKGYIRWYLRDRAKIEGNVVKAGSILFSPPRSPENLKELAGKIVILVERREDGVGEDFILREIIDIIPEIENYKEFSSFLSRTGYYFSAYTTDLYDRYKLSRKINTFGELMMAYNKETGRLDFISEGDLMGIVTSIFERK